MAGVDEAARGAGGQRGDGQAQDLAANDSEQQQPDGTPGQGGRGGNRGGNRAGGTRYGGGGNFVDQGVNQNGGYSGGWNYGPLLGTNYVDWTDRLRNVEELVNNQDLRTDVARIRDRARAIRLDYKKLGAKPDWDVVRTKIVAPLAEVRLRIAEELARRDSKEALVPLDRDPVPAQFSELVRHYYEQLGKSD